MKHINGVDVFARARSDDGQGFKVEELEVSVDGNHHDHYRRFYTRFCEGDVRFTFCLPSLFDAYGASTIHTKVFTHRQKPDFCVNHTQNWRADVPRGCRELRFPEPAEAPGQEDSDIDRVLQALPSGPSQIDTNALVASPEYDVPSFPGLVRAIFQLGHSQWLPKRFANRLMCAKTQF